MADSKLTGLAALTAPITTDLLYVVDDPGGTPISKKSTIAEVFTAAGITIDGTNLTLGGAAKIIGGTGTTSDLTLQTTSGVGAAGADMHFLVGNNGATEAMTILNSGFVGINVTGPTVALEVDAGAVTTPAVWVKKSSTGPVARFQDDTGDAWMAFKTGQAGATRVAQLVFEDSVDAIKGALNAVTGTGDIYLSANGSANKSLYVVADGDVVIGDSVATVGDLELARSGAAVLSVLDKTDASNYEGVKLHTDGAGTITLEAVTLGTGTDNVDVVLTPAGTGVLKVPNKIVASSDGDTYLEWSGSNTLGVYVAGVELTRWQGAALKLGANVPVAFTSSISNSPDTGISRVGAGILAIGNGSGAGNISGTLRLSGIGIANAAEGGTWKLNKKTVRSLHTLTLGATSDTTDISVPSGAKLISCSMNVNTAVADDAGDDTWSAAYITGATQSIVSGAAAAQNTKVDTFFNETAATPITSAVTQIRFTPNAGNFTAGVIEIVVAYETLTSLANA